MKLKKFVSVFVLLLTIPHFADAQTPAAARQDSVAVRSAKASVEERQVRAHMEFLAGDALQGRGSGTVFERVAAEYLAAQMRQFGVEPAGDKLPAGGHSFTQKIDVARNFFGEAPKMSFAETNGAITAFEHGKEIVIFRIGAAALKGKLQKLEAGGKAAPGAIVLTRQPADSSMSVQQLMQAFPEAAGVLIEESPVIRSQWENFAARRLSFTNIENVPAEARAVVFVGKEAAAKLSRLADGTEIEIKGALAEPQKITTWNAVGKLTGSDPTLASEIVLLSAHLDHLGVRENAPGDDKIFNGADDDASGCVAVIELARVLADGKRPRRTVYFVFYGSEEAGGFGAQYFVNTLPFPQEKLIANLQFEMIGRPDPKVAAEQLWLTGYDRSNLGAELARQGAKLVADPHPEQNFFQRSDNYTLARRGIVAHTVSSFGLHTDYHRASDDIRTIDFTHMTRAINSMVEPVRWLVNSDFKPAWHEGKKP